MPDVPGALTDDADEEAAEAEENAALEEAARRETEAALLQRYQPPGLAKEGKHVSARRATSSLFVSLYLVVLAFFILLNANARIEQEKREAALGSIRETFTIVKHRQGDPNPDASASIGSEVALRAFMAPVRKLAREAIQLMDAKVVEEGNVMEVTLPLWRIFFEGRAELRPAAQQFMVRLADQVSKQERGGRVDMESIFAADVKEGARPDATTSLSVARAGLMARTLMEYGVEEETIFVGMQEGVSLFTMRLLFHLRDESDRYVAPELPVAEEEGV